MGLADDRKSVNLMTVHVSKSECRHSGRTLRKPCRLVGRKTVGQRNELRCVHGACDMVPDRNGKA